MSQHVRAHIMLTLDGFGTGVDQSRERPFGSIDPQQLARWMFEDGENNRREIDAIVDFGAFVMGRNMFAAPGAQAWEPEWTGWWGPNPPYHGRVYVLTHHARSPIEMEGGTVFHFVTDGAESALAQARAAAGERDVSIAGGVSTLRHYLNAGAVDSLHIKLVPLLAGQGERLWDGVTARLKPTGARATRFVTHLDYEILRDKHRPLCRHKRAAISECAAIWPAELSWEPPKVARWRPRTGNRGTLATMRKMNPDIGGSGRIESRNSLGGRFISSRNGSKIAK